MPNWMGPVQLKNRKPSFTSDGSVSSSDRSAKTLVTSDGSGQSSGSLFGRNVPQYSPDSGSITYSII